MVVEIEHQADICVLRLKGRFLTGADVEYLSTKVDEIKGRRCNRVLADFREVPYIDSTGIGFIVGVYTSVTKTEGGRFVMVGPVRHVREVLDLTRLSTIIPIAADVESGIAMLRGGEAASGGGPGILKSSPDSTR
jgi:stage II sporulation protein AA (anti-sigma F factor antagonist)